MTNAVLSFFMFISMHSVIHDLIWRFQRRVVSCRLLFLVVLGELETNSGVPRMGCVTSPGHVLFSSGIGVLRDETNSDELVDTKSWP